MHPIALDGRQDRFITRIDSLLLSRKAYYHYTEDRFKDTVSGLVRIRFSDGSWTLRRGVALVGSKDEGITAIESL